MAMTYPQKLQDKVSAWPHVTVHPHRFGGSEFRFGRAEVGHVHRDGTVDIPFSTLDSRSAVSCTIGREAPPGPTFDMRNEEHVEHAAWLLRLSYLRYALKTASHPRELFEEESSAAVGPGA